MLYRKYYFDQMQQSNRQDTITLLLWKQAELFTFSLYFATLFFIKKCKHTKIQLQRQSTHFVNYTPCHYMSDTSNLALHSS